jgi:hypothetical protein
MIKKCILAVIVAGSLPLYGAAERNLPKAPPNTPRTPRYEDSPLANLLALKEGARPGNKRVSKLHRAARGGTVEEVELLLEKKANVHQLTPKDRTPVHSAARRKDDGSACAIVRVLLEAKARPCVLDEDRKTAYDYGSWAVKAVIREHLDKQREAAREAAELQEASKATQESQTPRTPWARMRSAFSFSRSSKSAPSSRKSTPSHSQASSPRPSLSRSLAPLSPRRGELFPFGAVINVAGDDEKDGV